ncbi:MAG: ester cyclase [Propionibacteriaceae bacterium]
MSIETTTRVMNGYFEALFHGGDFGAFFSDDVLWTTTETGEQVQGRAAVRDHIAALHTQLFDAHPEVKRTGISDGYAFIEADFVGTHTGEFAGIAATGAAVRVPYSVAYDVTDEGITALRGYLPVALLISRVQEAARAAV